MKKTKKKNKKSKNKRKKINITSFVVTILIVLTLFHGINNYIVLKEDKVPVMHFNSQFLTPTLSIFSEISGSGSKGGFMNIIDQLYFPPLFILTAQPIHLFFGKSPDIAAMTNMIYFLILLFAIYGIGKETLSWKTGLLAAAIVGFFPAIFGFSRVFTLDFALTSMVALSLYLLIKTNHFKNLKYSLIFGLSVGLGLLMKSEYTIYVLGPLLYYLCESFLITKYEFHKLKNFIISIILGLSLAATWYIPHFKEVVRYLTVSLNTYIRPAEIFYYLIELRFQIQTLFLTIFIISLVYFIINIKRKNYVFLLLYFIFPLIFLSLLKNNMAPRYMLPALPCIALVIAITVNKIKIKKEYLRNLAILLLIVVGVSQFFLLSYSHNISYGNVLPINRYSNNKEFSYQPIYIMNYGLISASTADWKTEEFVFAIINSTKTKPQVNILILSKIDYFYANSFRYYFEYYNISNAVLYQFDGGGLRQGLPFKTHSETVLNSEYILFSQKGANDPDEFNKKAFHLFYNSLKDNIDKFEVIKNAELPDGNEVYLYKQIKSNK